MTGFRPSPVNPKIAWPMIAVLAVLFYFPLFSHLEDLPFRLWDESRVITNALEMSRGESHLLVPTFGGQPDMWNTKPPLLIWIQAGFIKLLGFGELAVRLPSALAGLFTCFLLLWFGWRYLGRFWAGFFAALVLATTWGYVEVHITRTGDYDALLALFTTAFLLFLFIWTQTKKPRFLYLSVAALTLAVLTKSVAGLLFLPGTFLFLLFTKNLKTLFTKRHFYVAAGIFIAAVGAYYGAREAINPGYLAAVAENELGGRYTKALEGHRLPFFTYFKQLLQEQFSYWLPVFFIAAIAGFSNYEKKVRQLTHFLFWSVLTFLLVISISSTKLVWYTAPAFPLMALLAGTGLALLAELHFQRTKVGIIAVLILLFAGPYYRIFEKSMNPRQPGWEVTNYSASAYFKAAAMGKADLGNVYILHDEYAPHIKAYAEMMKEQGKAVNEVVFNNIRPRQHVLTYSDATRAKLLDLFDAEPVSASPGVSVWQVIKRK